MTKIIRLPSAFVIDTKVVGVSKPNGDGSSRQAIIRESVNENDLVKLKAEPDNPFDPNAIGVLTESNKQIGYLPKETASRLQVALNSDVSIQAKVSWVGGNEILGVGLRIELAN